ncbi:MAG TPA: HDIG domain-containing protein [Opitutaceae bacterium]|nr:HDIG domain-containing protein [Opitutaceae bacterium]
MSKKVQQLPGARRKPAPRPSLRDFFEQSRFVSGAIFILTVGAIVFISSFGDSTITPPVLPNQLAQIRVTAATGFTYESPLMTQQERAHVLNRVPPVYQLDIGAAQRFERHARELLAELVFYERNATRSGRTPVPAGPRLAPPVDIQAIATRFNDKGPYHVAAEDVYALLQLGDANERAAALEDGLSVLRDIYREGVHAETGVLAPGGVSLMQLRRPDGEIAQTRVQNMEQALTYLRVNVVAEGRARDVSRALFRVLHQGLAPNLVFDAAGTERLRADALASLKPATVTVAGGQTIIEPGTRVTPEQYEMLQAYRQHLNRSGGNTADDSFQLFGRVLLVLSMVLASILYLRLEDRETLLSNSRLGLLALVVILNLALVRGSYLLASLPYFLENFEAAALLPYLAPTALAPLIVAILIDAGSGIFMALVISIFTGVIYGNRLDLLVLTFLASLVGIYTSREVRRRSRIIKAASLGGLVVACFALLIGLVDQTPIETVFRQMLAGVATGAVTGIAVAGLLPALESLFQRTTDITLLELTDHNHPLLRLMQVEAPGTYHHSLIVAQLAEDAANVIGANPLLSRVCALFHDIGKTDQPSWFTENQRDSANPHDEHAPAHSANVIKSHVTKGLELGRRHRLPRPVLDVIAQHHGTTLIQSFYRKARATRAPSGPEPAEAAFRYDGPKPQFKESAIIFLADPIEAATRSLRTVGAVQLGELIDRVFAERIADGQLDEAPLTFEEYAKLKTSFTFTLLNMLHGRVAYATGEASPAATPLEGESRQTGGQSS